jgi:asparagine synthase (glutamine-hydrolysing)
VFLSGGLDSTIVLHHATQALPTLETFSVDFEMVQGAQAEAAKFNSDARLALQTSKHYGTKHTTFTISLPEVRTILDTALSSVDEPIANPTVVSQYLLSKWVRERGVVVALGGDGGDELFGGYTRHRIVLGAHYFQQLPKSVQKGVESLWPQTKKLAIPLGTRMHMQLMSLKPDQYQSIVGLKDIERDVATFFDARYRDIPVTLSPVDQFMRVDRESWLADESLARTDRTSMAFGVEARVPLLDIDLVSYADSIGATKKFTPWSNKKILRDAYKGFLPAHVYNQPKRGWISPGAKWFRDPAILAYATEVFSKDYYDGLSEIVDWENVRSMLTDHYEGGYHLYPLWNLLQLQVWAKKYEIGVS